MHDKLSNGRPYKMLTVLDEYTREALCVEVAPKMGSADVLEALYPLLLKRGKPEYKNFYFWGVHVSTQDSLISRLKKQS